MKLLQISVLSLVLALAAWAQNDRGTITGTVTDPASAVVPGATVTATNSETGSTLATTSTQTGNYSLPSLPAGNYNLSVEAAGFKKNVQQGLQVQVAQVIRVDIALQVGSATESITVEAQAPLLKTENAEQSVNVTGDRINQLPLNFGGGGGSTGAIRSPYAFNVLSPGVAGSGNSAVINGLPQYSYKVMIEGQSYTSGNDTNWTATVTQASVDMIEEFSLQTSNFSAEYGQVAGGVYNFTTRSGTNAFHGNGFEYFTNEALDARKPFQPTYLLSHPTNRKNDFGGSIGGPVWIPKLYNGRNKTFFFFNYEMFRNHVANSSGANTVPTALMRSGNFSEILNTGRVLGTDPLGRSIIENTIYDPGTARAAADGRIVTDPFSGNIIPINRIDPVSQKIQGLIPAPNTGDLLRNWFPDGSNTRKQASPSVKVDQNFSDNSKVSFYISKLRTDQLTSADGLPAPITAVRVQAIYGYTTRINYDKPITPRLLIHLGSGYVRFNNPDSSPASVLKFDAVGQLAFVGSATTPGGFPRLEQLSGTGGAGMNVNGGNLGPSNANNYYDGTFTSLANATYVRGSHTYKLGGEMRINSWTDQNTRQSQGRMLFGGGDTALPYNQSTSFAGQSGTIGFNYANFFLGLANSGVVNAVQDPQWRKKAWGLFLQDTWKVTRKLTLDYGIRWDLEGEGHEIHFRNTEFGPTIPNPKAGNLLGALAYEGYGAGRCNCQFTNTYPFAIGPRLGAAYQIDSKTVLRAGWGISYGDIPNYAYLTNTTLLGVGFNSINFNSPAFGQPGVVMKNGLKYNLGDLYVATLDPGAAAPTASGAFVNPPYFLDPNGGRPSRIFNWNIAIQREIMRNLVVEAAYVGNRGVWEQAVQNNPLLLNYQTVYAAAGIDINNAADRTLLNSPMSNAAVIARGFKVPYAGYPTSTTLANVLLRKYPQYSSVGLRWTPEGKSWYDSLQIKVTKRYSHGLSLTAAFTRSKALASTAATVNNYFNRGNSKSLSAFDRPYIFNTGFNYDTPKVGPNKLVRALVSDWTIGGLLTYSSGQLIGTPSSNNNLSQLTLQNTRMNRVAGQPLFNKDPNCHCFNPDSDLFFNPAAWQDAPAGQWGGGSLYYNDFRNTRQPSEQASIGRRFRITERMNLHIRAEFFNVFNRLYFPLFGTGSNAAGSPTTGTTYNAAGQLTNGFGFVNKQSASGQRNGQLVARFEF